MILFRCNASPEVGLGHITRCRALAQALSERGEDCVMVGPAHEYAVDSDPTVFSEWIEVDEWSSSREDAIQLLAIVKERGIRIAVLDDYRVDEEYQLLLQKHGLRWLQFDGTAKSSIWADWILNSSPIARAEDYQGIKRNPNASVLAGPNYALLRAEFREVATQPCNRPLQRVLVTFGGGDDRGAIEFVLASLVHRTEPKINFMVVSGKANPRNSDLIKWADSYGCGRVVIEIDPSNVARHFAGCDIAILAGGGSTYEVACCQVPMMLISIADNQTRHSLAWEKVGAAIFLGELDGANEDALLRAFNQMHESSKKRAELCKTARSICDGQGAARVAEAILNTIG
jgi:UDP-2,4-diacetamido-2,4,6-trideoxy-beta-L-altropyranose hydrolase